MKNQIEIIFGCENSEKQNKIRFFQYKQMFEYLEVSIHNFYDKKTDFINFNMENSEVFQSQKLANSRKPAYLITKDPQSNHIQKLITQFANNSIKVHIQEQTDSLKNNHQAAQRLFIVVDNKEGTIVLGPIFSSLMMFIVGYPRRGKNKKNYYCTNPQDAIQKYWYYSTLPDYEHKVYNCSSVVTKSRKGSIASQTKSIISKQQYSKNRSNSIFSERASVPLQSQLNKQLKSIIQPKKKYPKVDQHSKLFLYFRSNDQKFLKYLLKISVNNTLRYKIIQDHQQLQLSISVCRSKTNFLLIDNNYVQQLFANNCQLQNIKMIIYDSNANALSYEKNQQVVKKCGNQKEIIQCIRQIGFHAVSLKDIEKSIVKYGNPYANQDKYPVAVSKSKKYLSWANSSKDLDDHHQNVVSLKKLRSQGNINSCKNTIKVRQSDQPQKNKHRKSKYFGKVDNSSDQYYQKNAREVSIDEKKVTAPDPSIMNNYFSTTEPQNNLEYKFESSISIGLPFAQTHPPVSISKINQNNHSGNIKKNQGEIDNCSIQLASNSNFRKTVKKQTNDNSQKFEQKPLQNKKQQPAIPKKVKKINRVNSNASTSKQKSSQNMSENDNVSIKKVKRIKLKQAQIIKNVNNQYNIYHNDSSITHRKEEQKAAENNNFVFKEDTMYSSSNNQPSNLSKKSIKIRNYRAMSAQPAFYSLGSDCEPETHSITKKKYISTIRPSQRQSKIMNKQIISQQQYYLKPRQSQIQQNNNQPSHTIPNNQFYHRTKTFKGTFGITPSIQPNNPHNQSSNITYLTQKNSQQSSNIDYSNTLTAISNSVNIVRDKQDICYLVCKNNGNFQIQFCKNQLSSKCKSKIFMKEQCLNYLEFEEICTSIMKKSSQENKANITFLLDQQNLQQYLNILTDTILRKMKKCKKIHIFILPKTGVKSQFISLVDQSIKKQQKLRHILNKYSHRIILKTIYVTDYYNYVQEIIDVI